jgi:glycosyltransferase involved in cell wall biosynthesis
METFSRAMLEAEAFGLPIVSTSCGGVSEQVFWDFNALRFEPGDAAGLARQLGRVLGDDRLRDRMGFRSRAAFDVHLDCREMLDRYEAVIRSAVGPSRTAVTASRVVSPLDTRRAA